MRTKYIFFPPLLALAATSVAQTGAKEVIPQVQPKTTQGQAHCPL